MENVKDDKNSKEKRCKYPLPDISIDAFRPSYFKEITADISKVPKREFIYLIQSCFMTALFLRNRENREWATIQDIVDNLSSELENQPKEKIDNDVRKIMSIAKFYLNEESKNGIVYAWSL